MRVSASLPAPGTAARQGHLHRRPSPQPGPLPASLLSSQGQPKGLDLCLWNVPTAVTSEAVHVQGEAVPQCARGPCFPEPSCPRDTDVHSPDTTAVGTTHQDRKCRPAGSFLEARHQHWWPTAISAPHSPNHTRPGTRHQPCPQLPCGPGLPSGGGESMDMAL